MIIVVYDEVGRVRWCTTHFESGLQDMSEKYTEAGITHVLVSGDFDIINNYIIDGEVVDRPAIPISGIEDRPLKADGMDTFSITTEVPSTVKVYFGETLIDTVQTPLELTSDHPGTFTLVFEAEWPHREEHIAVEVVS